VKNGNSAARQRQVFAATGSLHEVTLFNAGEFKASIL
jgi:hypothetical protein